MSIEYSPKVNLRVHILYKTAEKVSPYRIHRQNGIFMRGLISLSQRLRLSPKKWDTLSSRICGVCLFVKVSSFLDIFVRVCICISMGLSGMGAIIAGYFHNDLMVTTDARYGTEIRETCWSHTRLPKVGFFYKPRLFLRYPA